MGHMKTKMRELHRKFIKSDFANNFIFPIAYYNYIKSKRGFEQDVDIIESSINKNAALYDYLEKHMFRYADDGLLYSAQLTNGDVDNNEVINTLKSDILQFDDVDAFLNHVELEVDYTKHDVVTLVIKPIHTDYYNTMKDDIVLARNNTFFILLILISIPILYKLIF